MWQSICRSYFPLTKFLKCPRQATCHDIIYSTKFALHASNMKSHVSSDFVKVDDSRKMSSNVQHKSHVMISLFNKFPLHASNIKSHASSDFVKVDDSHKMSPNVQHKSHVMISLFNKFPLHASNIKGHVSSHFVKVDDSHKNVLIFYNHFVACNLSPRFAVSWSLKAAIVPLPL